ncbi:L-2,4-diaminobutyrate decarboxylase [Maioricimonas rarisocia]|uniref:L-2,4-diaminobutyrate decarboxylase n=1 Tax=Maioricimonas rarisocia TaxID=2528026 RepID=A0A517Z4C5_9PLAN|nr:aminotransferase class V-fold PLP-dependent enzyme [Maioricimonas rarisocia]QDU37326.1 L-2,4-diaminobutyrate decarboxylase [Maioricimonas rarisocia]
MTFDHETLSLLSDALKQLDAGFDHLPDVESTADADALARVLGEVAVRMRDNYPYQHPQYIGQMLKPPHPMARLAYSLAVFLNPNNHAMDGGRASSRMEKEAVADLARMVGWEEHLGHLCSGGTMANFESLWVARELRPGEAVAASSLAHYTHSRLSSVLQVPFHAVPVDAWGRMDVDALEQLLEAESIGTVVVTLGTTAAGTVDPLDRILPLREKYGFRIHVDAAYGGYFRLVQNLRDETARAFAAMPAADSIVIDPHKHGLQPYGCGCVLFRDPSVGRIYRHDSPYTYFTSDELHLGEISLECSRPGAAAVALWATQQLLPPVPGGEFAAGLEEGREAALELHEWLSEDSRFVPLMEPELDIVIWAVRAEAASESSRRAREFFEEAERRDVYLALASFSREMAEAAGPVDEWDEESVLCLRACAMKPEHREWMGEIVGRLEEA